MDISHYEYDNEIVWTKDSIREIQWWIDNMKNKNSKLTRFPKIDMYLEKAVSKYMLIFGNLVHLLFPDSKQSLGQLSVMVEVDSNTSLLACWHWLNIGPTLNFQQLKYCCWPTVGTSSTHQRWILGCGAYVGPKTCLQTIVELSSLTLNLF